MLAAGDTGVGRHNLVCIRAVHACALRQSQSCAVHIVHMHACIKQRGGEPTVAFGLHLLILHCSCLIARK